MEIALILGALVGAVLGLTGAGGGILAVPALVAGLGWTISKREILRTYPVRLNRSTIASATHTCG
ncbi:MAG: hypothetical protein VB138_08520, partial [Burkholderia sp.]